MPGYETDTLILSPATKLTDPAAVWHVAIGRPKPNVTRAQVQAELVTLMEAFKALKRPDVELKK